jgi:type VI secretion system secreted protein Hcp
MASDFLLEIDGIKGESQDSKHKDTIEIESFSWGVSNSGTHAAGHGGGAGKASFQDLHCTANVSKASATLMLKCANGEHIKKFYTVTMEDLLVSSYQSGDSTGGNPVPTDQFSLNFAKIKYEYKPQNTDGSLGSAITGTYDLKKNKE